jgi:hypothetical protein
MSAHLFLCATSVSSVSLWLMDSQRQLTTEAQRTQRLHREELIAAIYVQVVVTPKAF